MFNSLMSCGSASFPLPCARSAFDYDTENMNSEDIYSSLKGVTEAIQNFSVRSQEDMNEPVQRREGEEVSRADISPLSVSAASSARNETWHGTRFSVRCGDITQEQK